MNIYEIYSFWNKKRGYIPYPEKIKASVGDSQKGGYTKGGLATASDFIKAKVKLLKHWVPKIRRMPTL